MSAILEQPIESKQAASAVVTLDRPRPVVQPVLAPALRPHVRRRAKASPSWLTVLGHKAALFSIVMLVAYSALSLIGQVKLEAARQTRLHATERAAEARGAEAVLSQELDRLTSPQGIEGWAMTHSFRSPDGTQNGQTLVAKL